MAASAAAAAAAAAARSAPAPSLHSRLLGTSVAQLLEAQQRLLGRLVAAPVAPLRVTLPRSGHTINAVVAGEPLPPLSSGGGGVENAACVGGAAVAHTPPAAKTALLCHGLGAALGFYYPNIDALLRVNGGAFDRVVAVDWLGFGGSSRPRCAAPRHRWWRHRFSLCRSRFDDEAGVGESGADAAAAFFVDPLEEFREAIGIGRFTLVGHSLGGYLSARYAMSHTGALEGLVLASPAGLFSLPPAPPPVDAGGASAAVERLPWALRALDAAWSANVTPFQLIRARGLLARDGPSFVANLLRRRFNNRFDEDTTELIAEYLWHTTALPGSGEFAMNSLLRPVFAPSHRGVYARVPVESVVGRLPRGVPVLALFGDMDWLAPAPGAAERFARSASEAGVSVGFGVTPGAGHHLYLDNAPSFNRAVNGFAGA